MQDRADRRVMPDIFGLRPLYPFIDADGLYLYRCFAVEVFCHLGQRVLPEAILLLMPSEEAQTKFVDRIAGPHQNQRLHDCFVPLGIRAESNPAGENVRSEEHTSEL